MQRMHPLLAGLYPPVDEVQFHRWPIESVLVNHPKLVFNLHHFSTGRPCQLVLLLLWDLSDITGDEWLLLLLHVKPFIVPIPCG
jgi:hypothetical protein